MAASWTAWTLPGNSSSLDAAERLGVTTCTDAAVGFAGGVVSANSTGGCPRGSISTASKPTSATTAPAGNIRLQWGWATGAVTGARDGKSGAGDGRSCP